MNTEIGLALDVKVICHHKVHGIDIQIPSTSGDKTKVWVVVSRSSNWYVDELRYRKTENLPEEVAQECMQDQERESIPKVKVQKPIFLFIKKFGSRCAIMNSVTETSGKPKSRNLSVNW